MVWNERNFQKPTTRPPTGPHKMSLAATVSPQFKLASGTWCKPWQNRFLSSPIWVFCSLMFMVDGRFKGFHGGGWENQNGPAGTNQPFNWTIHICFKNKASSRIQNDPNANLVIFLLYSVIVFTLGGLYFNSNYLYITHLELAWKWRLEALSLC